MRDNDGVEFRPEDGEISQAWNLKGCDGIEFRSLGNHTHHGMESPIPAESRIPAESLDTIFTLDSHLS